MEVFDDIRSYRDHEVSDVIQNLLNNADFFEAITTFRFPRLTKLFPSFTKKAVKQTLRKQLKGVDSIVKFQDVIAIYLKRIIEKTTSNLSESGLSELRKDRQYLFVSNHRDIVLDPALISYLLHQSLRNTVEIAIGDNLVKKDFISDLMKLNKSFLVKRSVQGREKLEASKLLSQYIHHTLESGNHVWIAQSEGRAKNGLDKTDPTILKMLHIAKRGNRKELSLQDCMNDLHILPVSISYEFDPCDELKARELYEIDHNGHFEKDERADIDSISTGIEGFKGDVHICFGTEISALDSDTLSIANQIDEQVIGNYKLHPSNYLAYEKIQQEDASIGLSIEALNIDTGLLNDKRDEFEQRYQNIAVELRPYFLQMYANPVLSQFSFTRKSQV